jgi:hypothetical protein
MATLGIDVRRHAVSMVGLRMRLHIFLASRSSLRHTCSRWRSADQKVAVIEMIMDVNRSQLRIYARRSLLPASGTHLTLLVLPYPSSLIFFLGIVTIMSDYEDKGTQK